MREELRDPGRLEHILTSIDNIRDFMEGRTRENLEKDRLLYYAVVKNLEIIGEASFMLSDDFVNGHPDTPWRRIVGLRHILVHDYYQVNADELWNIVQNDLDPLREQIVRYKSELASR